MFAIYCAFQVINTSTNLQVEAAPAGFPIRNQIDKHILNTLNAKGLRAAETATDAEFIRRTYLILNGVIPTAEEAKKFILDRAPNKRERLVDDLLASERYGMHFAVMWSDLLRERTRSDNQEGTISRTYQHWLRNALNKNMPYHQFVKELLTASGTPDKNGAVNFFLRDNNDRVETVNTVSGAFMGTRMSCAQCHDHPFDRWEQKDFHRLMAFFNRVASNIDANVTVAQVRKDSGIPDNFKGAVNKALSIAEAAFKDGSAGNTADMSGNMMMNSRNKAPQQPQRRDVFREMRESLIKDLGADNGGRAFNYINRNRVNSISERDAGDYRMPNDADPSNRRGGGVVVAPEFPWDTKLVAKTGSRRAALADYMIGHRQFAEVQVNRLWAAVFGKGLVHETDDFREGNPPSHPELLAYLADEFVASNFDNKKLLRLILTSSTYERSSKPPIADKPDEKYFSHFNIRRMTAEQIFDSILVATGRANGLQDVSVGGFRLGFPTDGSTRWAADVSTPSGTGSFLATFNQPDREALSIDRDRSGSITQALTMLNGRPTNEAVKARPGSLTHALLTQKMAGGQAATELYLATLTRPPTSAELQVGSIAIPSAKAEFLEDFQWSLLNTREFIFIK